MKRGCGRGQASIEFISIFGFVFLMTIPLIIIFFDQSGSVQDLISENQLRNIEIKIVDKAETVYYLGQPSKSTITAYFPDRIEEINISSRTITFRFRTLKGILHDITLASKINISGTISITPGIKYIGIEAAGDGVLVTT